MEHKPDNLKTPQPRPCSVPHSAPIAWLGKAAERSAAIARQSSSSADSLRSVRPAGCGANPIDDTISDRDGAAATQSHGTPTPDPLRAAIDLVLAHPEAVTEIVARAPLDAFPRPAGASRHDGWTGERMAAFLEVLADTGLVTEAARAVGLHRDSAYALRNRDPIFAAAMRAAQAKARPLVADGLLERSITGTLEHYYRDGVLVGERRHYESWLGLAVLKRLDKQAGEDRADGALAARLAADWNETLEAMRGGGTAAVDAALKAKADKADIPPSPPGCDDGERCWQDDDGRWLTDFPPPADFDGYESCEFDGFNAYERACTAEEAELLDAAIAAEEAAEDADGRAADECRRDAWFAALRLQVGTAPAS